MTPNGHFMMKTTPTQSQKQLNKSRTTREVQGKSFIEQDVETSTFSMEDQVITRKKDLVKLHAGITNQQYFFLKQEKKERKERSFLLLEMKH